jgi:hypothetical protein
MRHAAWLMASLLLAAGRAEAQVEPLPTSGLFQAAASAQKSTLELEKAATQQGVDNFKAGLGALAKGSGWLGVALKSATAGANLLKTFEPLTAEDKGYDPNYNPPGSPQIPSKCAGADVCGACFQSAYDELNTVRYRFEKLRRVYQSTKAFTNAGLSFGDNTASIHGITGLAWQTERRKIEQSLRNLDTSYDEKYAELAGALQKAVEHVGQCEAQHFNEPDWYTRYGFIYYSFMADRYKR